jgi:Uma2 family endonuclease
MIVPAGIWLEGPDIMDHGNPADPIDRKDQAPMATIATPLRIGPADNGRTMTFEEFLEADVEGGYRYELAKGVLEVNQVPNDPHGVVVANLYDAIGRYRRDHPGAIHRYGGGAEFQLVLPGMITGRNPDLGVVLRGAAKDWRGRRIPALAAEVVSRGSIRRDYETKREEYLAYGLLEYWIVDPLKRQVTVLTRRGDAWNEAVFHDQQIIASLVLPGFATTVAELWIDVEEDEDDPADPGANGD